MRRMFVMFLLAMVVLSGYAGTKRALIIGIGDYPEISGWAKINGDKDIPIVKKMLLQNGFTAENIVILCNEQATRLGIQESFVQLTSNSGLGDVVYIHFSGHGQQITDMNGDESDGYDEAWIPYDARATYVEHVYEGENHILDDELFAWFTDIRNKIGPEGNLVVVADACHSGDGSRGEGEDNEDCIRGTFISDLADASLQFIRRLTSSDRMQQPVVVAPKGEVDWVFISACKDYQCNQEYMKAGSLTTALSSITDKLTSLSYDELRAYLKRWMSDHLVRTQVPTIQKPQNTDHTTLL